MNTTLAMRILLVTALAAIVIGTTVILTAPTPPPSFGWSAYAPLSEAEFAGERSISLTTTELVGSFLLITGVTALAFWCGFAFGRRPRQP